MHWFTITQDAALQQLLFVHVCKIVRHQAHALGSGSGSDDDETEKNITVIHICPRTKFHILYQMSLHAVVKNQQPQVYVNVCARYTDKAYTFRALLSEP